MGMYDSGLIKVPDSMNVEKFIYRKRMLNAAIIGINTENKKYKNFITNWKNLAIQKFNSS